MNIIKKILSEKSIIYLSFMLKRELNQKSKIVLNSILKRTSSGNLRKIARKK